jgi:hypothetical protein
MGVATGIRLRPWHWLLPAGLAALAAALLFWFDPSHIAFYPSCLFHHTTGWLCPGCGSLRALHHLLHGHLVTAFRFNPMLITLLPLLAWHSARYLMRKSKGEAASFAVRPAWFWLFLAAALAFGILRNLPAIPFSSLPQ